MTAGPVIVRELREESRRTAVYWLRVTAALALGGVLVFVALRPVPASPLGVPDDGPDMGLVGTQLFGGINLILLVLLTALVPLLTADAISRERREGTLGLLFLTPLSAPGIVLGKTVVHVLRGLTLYLTAAPWLMLPVLLGGVTWEEVSRALLLQACLLLVALSAGLLATSQTKVWTRAVLLAETYALLFALLFLEVHRGGLSDMAQNSVSWLGTLTGLGPNPTPLLSTYWYESQSGGVIERVIDLVGFSANLGFEFGPGLPSEHTRWGVMLAELGTGGDQAWRQWLFLLLGGCLLGLFSAVRLAAWQVRRAWRELPPSPAQRKLKEVFVKPRFWRGLFRSRLRRALNRNPVGWLHQYAAEARLVKWGWCLCVVVVETLLVTQRFRMDYFYSLRAGEEWLLGLLVAGLAFSAAGSFRRERESGVLELLLVTPLTPAQIIHGRLRGVWTQFTPALAVLLLCRVVADRLWGRWEGLATFLELVLPLLAVGGLVSVVGLYLSSFRLNHLAAWLGTLGIGLGLPALSMLLDFRWGMSFDLDRPIFGPASGLLFIDAFMLVVTLAVAAVFVGLLWRRLDRRGFVVR